jgi:hypothetical protein
VAATFDISEYIYKPNHEVGVGEEKITSGKIIIRASKAVLVSV